MSPSWCSTSCGARRRDGIAHHRLVENPGRRLLAPGRRQEDAANERHAGRPVWPSIPSAKMKMGQVYGNGPPASRRKERFDAWRAGIAHAGEQVREIAGRRPRRPAGPGRSVAPRWKSRAARSRVASRTATGCGCRSSGPAASACKASSSCPAPSTASMTRTRRKGCRGIERIERARAAGGRRSNGAPSRRPHRRFPRRRARRWLEGSPRSAALCSRSISSQWPARSEAAPQHRQGFAVPRIELDRAPRRRACLDAGGMACRRPGRPSPASPRKRS